MWVCKSGEWFNRMSRVRERVRWVLLLGARDRDNGGVKTTITIGYITMDYVTLITTICTPAVSGECSDFSTSGGNIVRRL